MKEKLAVFFKSKTFLILSSVLCAVVAWLFVLNFTNPITERTIEIPINVINESLLSENELLNMSRNVPQTATVTVTGREKIINNLTALDFECNFDVGDVKQAGGQNIKLSPPVCKKIGVNIKKYNPSSYEFVFDKTSVTTLQVVIDYSNDLLKSGYEFINVYPDTESIQVTGMESELSELDYISIDLNSILEKNSVESSKSASYIGKFIKKNGEDVTSKFDPVSIIVKMEVGKRVPVVYSVSGSPKKDFYVNSDSISNDKILIQGPASELRRIEAVNVGTVNIEGLSDSVNREFNAEDCLPDGVTVYGASKVTVSVEILEYETRLLTFTMDEINLAGCDLEHYVYDFDISSVTVRIKGIKEELDNVKKSSLEPTIDLEGKVMGTYPTVPLRFSSESGRIEIIGEYTVKVIISMKQESNVE